LKQDLEVLCLLLADSPYLLGDKPTRRFGSGGSVNVAQVSDGPYLDLPTTLRVKEYLADSVVYEPFSPGAIASTPNIANH